MTGSVGPELRQARERAHLSLQDLSARTKIRASLLDAIEREQFDRLPAGLLTRGFLRAYAREVGLDPESVVRQYVSEFGTEQMPTNTRPEPEPESEWGPIPAGRAKWAFVVPAIPLALAALFFLRVQPRDAAPPELPDVPAAVATGGELVSEVGIAKTSRGIPAPSDAGAPVVLADGDGRGFHLEIHPAAVVWIEAEADGKRVLYELVQPGERRSIDVQSELTMHIGDAAAFTYSINGVPGRSLGRPAQVRDVRMTAANFTSFQAQ